MAKLHGKNTRIYLDGYDISGDSNSFEPTYAADVVEVTAFTDTSKAYVVGLPDPKARLGGVFNDDDDRVHAIASARVGSMVFLHGIWGDARGSKGAGGSVNMDEYSVNSGISAAVTTSAAFSGGDTKGVFEFLTTIQNKANLASTAPGTTGVDMGTSFVAIGGSIAGHCQFLNGTGTVVIQSSTAAGTAATWTTRITIAGGAAPWGSRAMYGGTVPQFWRAVLSGGTGTAWVGIARTL